MPKDDWAKDKRKRVGNRVSYENATNPEKAPRVNWKKIYEAASVTPRKKKKRRRRRTGPR